MMLKKVGFKALIQEVKIKSLVTGDKSARITLEMDSPSDNLLDSINRLHKADRLVAVLITETEKS